MEMPPKCWKPIVMKSSATLAASLVTFFFDVRKMTVLPNLAESVSWRNTQAACSSP